MVQIFQLFEIFDCLTRTLSLPLSSTLSLSLSIILVLSHPYIRDSLPFVRLFRRFLIHEESKERGREREMDESWKHSLSLFPVNRSNFSFLINVYSSNCSPTSFSFFFLFLLSFRFLRNVWPVTPESKEEKEREKWWEKGWEKNLRISLTHFDTF